ncbi:MAG TPA: NAD-glutamate dehydrogenase domain-containing protein [Oligoflexus sp.]|uniref:NAD-glutamate dehydrogenase domain-containing protein n=1 Tax=Oligoflexus sp. TaxID=1971216 RepID=UPI002D7F17A2|nr:NAD-glutamate dehydrogenase domain-containing protein [Oligoflexus sp.]HET9241046.1 NAD-glutamate dehydrogenase domain-containing protein [Oligoflexus sp.]
MKTSTTEKVKKRHDGELSLDFQDSVESPSYAREMSGEQLEHYIEDIAETVRIGLDHSISILTPWFFNAMPPIYYQTTPRQEKVRHLSAIITGHVFETKQTVELWDRDRSKVTYIGPGGDRKILIDMATRIKGNDLKMGAVYFSRDKLLFLSTFICSKHKALDRGNKHIADKIEYSRQMMQEEYGAEKDVNRYLEGLDNDLVTYATTARLSLTYRMVKHMIEHQGAHTILDTIDNSTSARLTLGFKNISPANMLEPVLNLIHRYDFNVGRAFLAKFEEGYPESITVMHLILSHGSGEKVTSEMVPMIQLTKALRTLGWVDYDDFSKFSESPFEFSINATNLIRSWANWCHIFLSKQNPYAFSLYKINNTFFQHRELLTTLVKMFRTKFDPAARLDWEKAYAALEEEANDKIDDIIEEVDRSIFRECINFITNCQKTNYFLSTKTGLAFRINPEVLDKKYYDQMPFSIFYVIGKEFRFFQVRWKDIARGGVRVVMPRSDADYDMALAGLFDEVYGLSNAQQLKNKDIPEGGSKAVLVLKPGGHRDQAVKGSINALLDLLVEEDESHETAKHKVVSFYNKPDIIYLGPDENITNELIVWIPEQARRRGYRYAAAFMSSKPGEGINHKEFGVTSEGLNVYVDNVLSYLGIDPKTEKFTVKITGGPDGDVAGNELKILHREYGENARVVAVSDGYGAAHDPQGLDWSELMRLFREGKSIMEFNKDKLSRDPNAFVVIANNNENIRIRNEVYRKVYADIFIPAGGRPYSVNDKNWVDFFGKNGQPSVRAIVEGANIFFTKEARRGLQEKGIIIVKDSSANKTGVICSSYEIIASLTLSAQEFLDIKPVYVSEVIQILRKKADQEAKLLFRELSQEDNRNLVDLSLLISKEINHLTDILLENLSERTEDVLKDPFFQDIVIRHCPPVLVEKYHDRILERLPDAHKIAIISSSVASYVVYKEGLGWMRTLPKSKLFDALIVYMQKDKLATQLMESVMASGIHEREQINAILARSAARNLTDLEIQQKLMQNT